jgi:hypothetical protein
MNQLKLNTDKIISLENGLVIPAIPLTLNRNRKMDERRQGLLEGIWTLNEKEIFSPGQKEEIDRIYKAILN